MSSCAKVDFLLVLPRLRVQNANAISSPQTHGFPSMTAFLGWMWALERKCREQGLDLAFEAVGVVCHDHQELVTEDRFVKTFRLTRNPIDKTGKTAAIVEEGRMHLELTLILAVNSNSWSASDSKRRDADAAHIAEWVSNMRIAGGTVVQPLSAKLSRYRPYVEVIPRGEADRADKFRKLRSRWLPGFTLVARDALLDERLGELQTQGETPSRLDAWLSLARINWRYEQAEAGDEKTKPGGWKHDREGLGWLVPIPVGYGALTEIYEPGVVANARDATTPFRFVESLYSVGQWVSPHRLSDVRELLWYAGSQPAAGLYRCRNDFSPAGDDPFEDDLF